MKGNISLCSALALSSVLFFFSCSKKSDPAPSRDQLLSTAKGWKITDASVTVANVTQSIMSSIPACSLDNIIYFKSTGAYLEDEGATKCTSTDPQTVESGTWKFNTDKTVITVISSDPNNPGTVTLTVVSLTATTLVVKESFSVNGVTGFATSTLTAL
jgi:hypothetical protein